MKTQCLSYYNSIYINITIFITTIIISVIYIFKDLGMFSVIMYIIYCVYEHDWSSPRSWGEGAFHCFVFI